MDNQRNINNWFEQNKVELDNWDIRSLVIDKYDEWGDSPVDTQEEINSLLDLLISINILLSRLKINVNSSLAKRIEDISKKGKKFYGSDISRR